MHNDKFISSYIEFINQNFNMNEHYFFIFGGILKKEMPIPNYLNIKYIEKPKIKNIFLKILITVPLLYYNLLKKMIKSEKIYFHSLFDERIILFLFIFRKFLKKSNWIIWGGDLYCYEKRRKDLKYFLWYKIEDYVKSNVAYVNTLVPQDYEVAKKYYKIKGKYKRALYTSKNNFDFIDKLKPDIKKEIYVQIGNSADPSNKHFEILDTLKKFKKEKIKIFSILSYGGDQKYINKVIEYGNNIFGTKFIPIVDFLSRDKYWQYLINIDILIFNHKRQQGLGNIAMLSYFEKKIYLRDDISSWDYLTKDIKLKLNSYKKIKNETFEKFTKNNSIGNKEVILKTLWSNEYRKKIWEENFKDNRNE